MPYVSLLNGGMMVSVGMNIRFGVGKVEVGRAAALASMVEQSHSNSDRNCV